jgi:NTP pyrophosphatase (non-canonical NTP hydrolase)
MTPEQIDAERGRFEASEFAQDLDLTRQVDRDGYLYYPSSVCWLAWLARAQEDAASIRLDPEPATPEPVAWKDGWNHLSRTNLKRCLLWHPGGVEDWSLSDWAVAAAGEMGEVCDAIKKLNRTRDGIKASKTATIEDVGKEIADTVLYLDLLAQRIGFNLADLIEQKFNEVSAREGFDITLEAAAPEPARTLGADQAERLAVDIRNAAGKHNDDALPVVHVVRKMAAALDASPEPARAEPPALPPGWVAVPVEPTDEMLRDGAANIGAFFERHGLYPHSRAVYRAMLAAAQPRPAVSLPDGWPWDAETRQSMQRYLRAGFDAYSPISMDNLARVNALIRWLDQSPEQGGRSDA